MVKLQQDYHCTESFMTKDGPRIDVSHVWIGPLRYWILNETATFIFVAKRMNYFHFYKKILAKCLNYQWLVGGHCHFQIHSKCSSFGYAVNLPHSSSFNVKCCACRRQEVFCTIRRG